MRCPECNHVASVIAQAGEGLGCCPVCGESREYVIAAPDGVVKTRRRDQSNDASAGENGDSSRPLDADKSDTDGWESDAWAEDAWEADRWEIDDRLREAERLLGRRTEATRDMVPGESSVGPATWTRADVGRIPPPPVALRKQKTSGKGSRWFGWLSLVLGVIGLSCGASLLAWSHWAERPDLWSLGLPIVLVGQIGLTIGFIAQLDALRREHRSTEQELETVDETVDALRHRTEMLGTTHNSAAQAFYSHLVDGASPHVLLTDLKSQLDLLAIKMSDERSHRR